MSGDPHPTWPATELYCPGCHGGDLPDFDHFVDAHAVPEELWAEAFAAWLAHTSGSPPPNYRWRGRVAAFFKRKSTEAVRDGWVPPPGAAPREVRKDFLPL